MTEQTPQTARPSNQSFFKRRWKLILNIVTVLALLALVYAIRDQVVDVFRNLKNVSLWALLLMIPIQLLNYHAQTKMYQQLFAAVGNNLDYKFMYKMALELNFVNHVFPSGGVTGISYFGLRLKNSGHDITGAKATLVQLMKLVLIFLSFQILIVLGLFFLAAMGKANNLVILLAGTVTTLMVVGTLGLTYMMGSRERITTFFTTLTRWLNQLIKLVRPRHPETINISRVEKAFEDLHANFETMREHLDQLRKPFGFALLANLTEVLTIYVVFIAFGHWVNFGAVILAYAIANFAGLISVLPGGVGIYEALMTTTLVAGGVPAALSIPVIVMYRVLSTLLQVPPGYYLYHKNLRKA